MLWKQNLPCTKSHWGTTGSWLIRWCIYKWSQHWIINIDPYFITLFYYMNTYAYATEITVPVWYICRVRQCLCSKKILSKGGIEERTCRNSSRRAGFILSYCMAQLLFGNEDHIEWNLICSHCQKSWKYFSVHLVCDVYLHGWCSVEKI